MMYDFFRKLLFRVDPERAHRAVINALRRAPQRRVPRYPPSLAIEVAGLRFPNPIGLAAGFDKNAEAFDAMLGHGFGFVEVGTVTPRPQAGNPKPRLFRLEEDRGVINRMGFNNEGQEKARLRLARRRPGRGIVGANIGANKDSEDRIADYRRGVVAMSRHADYLTVNISSPNTPGLRQLQDPKELAKLLKVVRETRPEPGPPVFLKVAPDLAKGEATKIVNLALREKVDAIIVSNTTIDRPDTLRSPHAAETGGLSGAPLKVKALETLRAFHKASKGRIPLIAAGGIETVDDVIERMRAGASLVQIYSALVYEGPGLAVRLARELGERLETEGIGSVAEWVGSE